MSNFYPSEHVRQHTSSEIGTAIAFAVRQKGQKWNDTIVLDDQKTSDTNENKGRDNREYFVCGDTAHMFNACPFKNKECKLIAEKKIVAVLRDKERSSSALCDSDILLDTGSNLHVFNNLGLLTNVRELPIEDQLLVEGAAGDTIHILHAGIFGAFGEVYYTPDVLYNILSAFRVSETMSLQFCAWNDCSRIAVTDPEGGEYVFSAKLGLFVLDLAPRSENNWNKCTSLVLTCHIRH